MGARRLTCGAHIIRSIALRRQQPCNRRNEMQISRDSRSTSRQSRAGRGSRPRGNSTLHWRRSRNRAGSSHQRLSIAENSYWAWIRPGSDGEMDWKLGHSLLTTWRTWIRKLFAVGRILTQTATRLMKEETTPQGQRKKERNLGKRVANGDNRLLGRKAAVFLSVATARSSPERFG